MTGSKHSNTHKGKLVYIAPSQTSFVTNDIVMFLKSYHVITNIYNWKKKHLTPLFLFRQFFFLIYHLPQSKAAIASSGGYWTLLPAFLGKIFRTPFFIVLNGSDCAALPQLNYGDLRKPLLKKINGLSYKHAKILLPVSSSLIFTKNTYYTDDKSSYQGIKHFFPSLPTKTRVIPNGFDYTFWSPMRTINKEPNSFLAVFSPSQFILKGGDIIIETAKAFPEYRFYIAGITNAPEGVDPGDNVSFLGYLEKEKLKEYYSRSQYYFQLSIYEGFGCALCEAMLCKCIPIVSSVNILPEIVGETGFVLQKRRVTDLINLINKAMHENVQKQPGNQARQRIIDQYPMERREYEMKEIISGVSISKNKK